MESDRDEEPRRYFVPAPAVPSAPPAPGARPPLPFSPPPAGAGPATTSPPPARHPEAAWHPEAAPRGRFDPAPRPRRRGAGAVATLVLLVAALVVVPAVTVVWTRSTLRDAHTWTSTFGPLHEDPQVARSLAELIADTYGNDRVPRAQVVAAAELAIRSELFGTAWEGALVTVHDQALAVVDGRNRSAVELDLSPVIDQLEAAELIEPGSQDGRRTVPLIGAEDTDQLRSGSQALDRVAFVVPVAAAVLVGLGLLVARNRLRALAVLGASVAVVAVVSALVTGFVPGAVIDALVSDPARGAARPAAEAVGDRLVSVLSLTAAAGAVAAAVGVVVDRLR